MKPRALIVGATGGIGAALARQFAAHGYDLALSARDGERLARLAGGFADGVAAATFAADLADPAAPAAIVRWLGDRPVDALVNAAGSFAPVRFADGRWSDDEGYMRVMIGAPCELTHRLLPRMVARGSGRVLTVASLLGLLPGVSNHSLYCAAKAFLIRFSQAIHLETRGAGVHVTALCPGLTETDFFRRNGTRDRYRAATPGWLWQGPDEVARAGYAALSDNRAICVPGLANKVIAGLCKALPETAALSVAAAVAPRFR